MIQKFLASAILASAIQAQSTCTDPQAAECNAATVCTVDSSNPNLATCEPIACSSNDTCPTMYCPVVADGVDQVCDVCPSGSDECPMSYVCDYNNGSEEPTGVCVLGCTTPYTTTGGECAGGEYCNDSKMCVALCTQGAVAACGAASEQYCAIDNMCRDDCATKADCDWAETPSETYCGTAATEAAGAATEGQCYVGDCIQNSECSGGFVEYCNAATGLCADKSCTEDTLSTDCGDGYFCVEEVCAACSNTIVGSNQCPATQNCDSTTGACETTVCDPTADDYLATCTMTGYCNPDSSTCTFCDDTSSCNDNYLCNVLEGYCVTADCSATDNNCPSWTTCTDGACTYVACTPETVADDCPSTNLCNANGYCAACTTQSDCGTGMDCRISTGLCYADCTEDTDCEINEVCNQTGHCEAPTCISSAGCPNATSCVDEKCDLCTNGDQANEGGCEPGQTCAVAAILTEEIKMGQCYTPECSKAGSANPYTCEEDSEYAKRCDDNGFCVVADCEYDVECVSGICGDDSVCTTCDQVDDNCAINKYCNGQVCMTQECTDYASECRSGLCNREEGVCYACDQDAVYGMNTYCTSIGDDGNYHSGTCDASGVCVYDETDDDGLSGWAIFGIILAAIVGLALCFFLVICCMKKGRGDALNAHEVAYANLQQHEPMDTLA